MLQTPAQSLFLGLVVVVLLAVVTYFGFAQFYGFNSSNLTTQGSGTTFTIIDNHPDFQVSSIRDVVPDLDDFVNDPIHYDHLTFEFTNEAQPQSLSWSEVAPYASYRIARAEDKTPTITLHLSKNEFEQYGWSPNQISNLTNHLVYQALLETITNTPEGTGAEIIDESSQVHQETQLKAQQLLRVNPGYALVHIRFEPR